MHRSSALLAGLVLLFTAVPGTAQTPYLVRDINSQFRSDSSDPENLVEFGDLTVFVADDGESGHELWASDGTAGGTYRLSETCPTVCSQKPRIMAATPRGVFFTRNNALWIATRSPESSVRLTELGSSLVKGVWVPRLERFFFPNADAAHGHELWVSDGTVAGTRLFADLEPGPEPASSFASPQSEAFQGRLLFFRRVKGELSLWTTDGTLQGTRPLLPAGVKLDPTSLPTIAFGRFVVFRALRPNAGAELWSSDGTARGTVPLGDLTPGPRSSMIGGMTVAGDRLFFRAETGQRGAELWVTDGTPRGTRVLTDLAPAQGFTAGKALGNRLVFSADDGMHGWEPWISDGTRGGTRLLRDLCSGPCSGASELLSAVEYRGRAYFPGIHAARGAELWTTDGTPAGTRMVLDVCPGACHAGPSLLTVKGNDLIFLAHRGANRYDLYRTRGTRRSTVRLTGDEVFFGRAATANVPGALLFVANDAAHGTELWRTDGTPAGTLLVRDIAAINREGAFPRGLQGLGSTLLFLARDEEHEMALWKSDGTAGGTVRVRGFDAASVVDGTAEAGGLAYFVLGSVLWRSDGSAAGTFQLSPQEIQVDGSVEALDGRLFFAAPQGLTNELWTTDGTVGGTRRVFKFPETTRLSQMTAYRGRLFFTASEADGSRRLWVSDGTAGGTRLWAALAVGALVEHGGLLYFFTDSGAALWRTDGTEAGTQAAIDLSLVPSQNAGFLASSGSRLIWANSEGLWSSDGTVLGTHRIHEVQPEADGLVAPFRGALYFTVSNRVLWRTDGTEEGTMPILGPDGEIVDQVSQLTALGAHLYIASHGLGSPLLVTDGITATAALVRLRADAIDSPVLGEIGAAGSRLFFSAFEAAVGTELWALQEP